MNASRATSLCVGLALAVALPPGCRRGPSAADAPLAGAAIGGPFALVDQDGHGVTDRSFAGRYRLMYFGYTFCPDVCPTTLQLLTGGYRRFAAALPAAAARLVPIFVSVDPERDTPAVMKRYVAAFDPHLIGLTGSAAQIAAVARGYKVSYRREGGPGAKDYLVDHSSVAILFGPDGGPILPIAADETPDQIAKDLATWVR